MVPGCAGSRPGGCSRLGPGQQREGGSRAPPRRVSPGSGRAPPVTVTVRVSRPCRRCQLCRTEPGPGRLNGGMCYITISNAT